MASASTNRLRCQPLSHRLGTATGHLPGGTHQHQLDPGQGPPEKRGHQNQVLDQRLSGMSVSLPLYASYSSYTPHCDHSSTGAIRGLETEGEQEKTKEFTQVKASRAG